MRTYKVIVECFGQEEFIIPARSKDDAIRKAEEKFECWSEGEATLCKLLPKKPPKKKYDTDPSRKLRDIPPTKEVKSNV